MNEKLIKARKQIILARTILKFFSIPWGIFYGCWYLLQQRYFGACICFLCIVMVLLAIKYINRRIYDLNMFLLNNRVGNDG